MLVKLAALAALAAAGTVDEAADDTIDAVHARLRKHFGARVALPETPAELEAAWKPLFGETWALRKKKVQFLATRRADASQRRIAATPRLG